MAYFFEKKQDFKFELIDDDGQGSNDYIGDVECSMGQIMGAKAQCFSAQLLDHGQKNKKRG